MLPLFTMSNSETSDAVCGTPIQRYSSFPRPSRGALAPRAYSFICSHPPRGWRSADRRVFLVLEPRLLRRGAHLAIGALASRRSAVTVLGPRSPRAAAPALPPEPPRGPRQPGSSSPDQRPLNLPDRTSPGRHAPLRLQDRLRRRPSMSEDESHLAHARYVVNSRVQKVDGSATAGTWVWAQTRAIVMFRLHLTLNQTRRFSSSAGAGHAAELPVAVGMDYASNLETRRHTERRGHHCRCSGAETYPARSGKKAAKARKKRRQDRARMVARDPLRRIWETSEWHQRAR